jgi:hypothetical protein
MNTNDLIVKNVSPEVLAILQAIPEGCDVNDLASYIATILINEYGSHNYLPFIISLIDHLENEAYK